MWEFLSSLVHCWCHVFSEPRHLMASAPRSALLNPLEPLPVPHPRFLATEVHMLTLRSSGTAIQSTLAIPPLFPSSPLYTNPLKIYQ